MWSFVEPAKFWLNLEEASRSAERSQDNGNTNQHRGVLSASATNVGLGQGLVRRWSKGDGRCLLRAVLYSIGGRACTGLPRHVLGVLGQPPARLQNILIDDSHDVRKYLTRIHQAITRNFREFHDSTLTDEQKALIYNAIEIDVSASVTAVTARDRAPPFAT